MTQDVEMKDQPAPPLSQSSSTSPVLQHLKEIGTLIETGAHTKEATKRLNKPLRFSAVAGLVGGRREQTRDGLRLCLFSVETTMSFGTGVEPGAVVVRYCRANRLFSYY
ncbi:putative 26S proteasome non-ATPase regulatory subunit 3 [Nymphaea thermarum]|nr:putative 26S proteasome non-ATPase regulatory subunit 3 [Nymphaea thermarum]